MGCQNWVRSPNLRYPLIAADETRSNSKLALSYVRYGRSRELSLSWQAVMYGMVNRAIEDLVVSNAGIDVWNSIRQMVQLENVEFVDSAPYNDDITYKLVQAASDVLGQSPEDILHSFGRHWILYTSREGWSSVFDLGGATMFDFIKGLDAMHARVQIALPEAITPEFSVVEHLDYLEMTYRSPRAGLAPMVLGLLDGLAERFGESWQVEHVLSESSESCEIFHLKQVQAQSRDDQADAA